MFDIGRTQDLFNAFSERELTWVFGAGAVLLIAAAALLAMSRFRIFARGLGILGVLVIMVGLFAIHQQTVVERPNSMITVTRPRFPESLRYQIRLALFGLPIVAAGMMAAVYMVTRRWLRAALPDLLTAGLRQFYDKNYDAALATYNRALSIEPHRGESFYQRGCVQEARGENALALADFNRALDLDPRLLNARNRRGRLLLESGDLDGALADFERALDVLPNDLQALLHRGIVLSRKGRLREAVVDFERVLHLTNHTDYAEPAKHYLRLFGVLRDGVLPSNALANGNPAAQANPEPAPHDYVI